MSRSERNPERRPIEHRFKVICSKHDDDQIDGQMRSKACGKVGATIELSASDGRSWIRRVRCSTIQPFFDYHKITAQFFLQNPWPAHVRAVSRAWRIGSRNPSHRCSNLRKRQFGTARQSRERQERRARKSKAVSSCCGGNYGYWRQNGTYHP
jgi:hypothetical protein